MIAIKSKFTLAKGKVFRGNLGIEMLKGFSILKDSFTQSKRLVLMELAGCMHFLESPFMGNTAIKGLKMLVRFLLNGLKKKSPIKRFYYS